MRFAVLGPLQVSSGGGRLEPLGPLQRLLLGLLVSAAARPLSSDVLCDALWGPARNDRVAGRLQVHVHRLRRLLGDPALISHGPLGYALVVGADDVDSRAFEVVLDRALAPGVPAEQVVTRLTGALALWRGPAYDGLTDPMLEVEARRLAERRIDAIQGLATAHLVVGQPELAAGLLDGPVQENPWREELVATRMVALQAAGRQADALELYRAVRDRLVDELGVEPGPALRSAHDAVLGGGEPPALAAARPGLGTPSQLPAPPSEFTGRAPELARIDAALTPRAERLGATPICVISGTAGVGKSALALHWAHSNLDRFPDGQVHVDLRGWSGDTPVLPVVALTRILRAFGRTTVGGDVEECAGALRTLLRDRSALLVLDNAGSVEQVRPMLPAAPGCAVLVTSRDHLSGLAAREGAARVDVDRLPDPEAVGLLARLLPVGSWAVDADLVSLAERCARLPLALRIAAEYVRSRPGLGVLGAVAELADPLVRLDVLDGDADPDTGVRAMFAHSYARLDPVCAQVFRALGLLPAPDVDLPAVAAMTGLEVRATRTAVTSLVRSQLVEERRGRPKHPRFGMHDLLGAFASELAREVEGADTCSVLLDRLFDHYAAGAATAAPLLDPGVAAAGPQADNGRLGVASAGGVQGPALADAEDAAEWLRAELPTLVAAAAAASPAVDRRLCAMAGALHDHLHGAGQLRAGRALHTLAIAAAARLGDAEEESNRLNHLAFFEAGLGQVGKAAEHLARATEVLGEHASGYRRARMHTNQAILLSRRGRYVDALARVRQGLAIYAADPRPDPADTGTIVPNVHNTEGTFLIELGRLDEARTVLTRALAEAADVDSPIIATLVVHNLSLVALRSGCITEAETRAEEMLERTSHPGLRAFRGEALNLVGCVHTAHGRAALAGPCHRQALGIARRSGDSGLEVESLVRLAESMAAAGDLTGGLATFTDAATAASAGAVLEQVRALRGLGATYVALGRPTAARAALEEALALCDACDLDGSEIACLLQTAADSARRAHV